MLPDAAGCSPVLILPSSLRRADRLASVVRAHLRGRGIASHLVLPTNPVAEFLRLGANRSHESWSTVTLEPSDNPHRTIRMPARLVDGDRIWTVTDVDAVSGRGPFVLDLLARYVHPVSRIRFVASPSRSDAAVEVNLAAKISVSVIGKEFGNFSMVGVTSDLVAAELFAIALADEDIAADRPVVGPWEDRVVQRATELDLGVRIPEELTISLSGAADKLARGTIERVASKIGVVVT